MKIRLHKQARTTPAIRQEIRESSLSERALAEKYGISRSTVRKWKQRQSVEDNSHRPHTIHTALSPIEELFAVGLRWLLQLSLDDLLLTIRVFLQSSLSRSALDRCLRRHGISKLSDLPLQCVHSSKTDDPGVLCITAIDLSPLLKASQQRVLYLAVDLASRWLYAEIRPAHTSTTFLQDLLGQTPFPLTAVHTTSNSEFTTSTLDALQTSAGEEQHPFPLLCHQHNISHHRHDVGQAKSVSEVVDGLIGALNLQKTRWSLSEAREMLADFCSFFNTELPLKRLRHRPPLNMIQSWQGSKNFAAIDAAPTQAAAEGSAYATMHRNSEEEELFQLRHANRRLRLEHALLARSQTLSSIKQ
ncbi:MAG: hypothetical protein AB7U29_02780 [Desulfobulbus sp.]